VEALVARLGLGCGRFRGGFEESNSRRLLDVALKCGINYFDTAPSYGPSERILGYGLRGVRSRVQICTKVGLTAATPRPAQRIRGLLTSAARAALPHAIAGRLKRRSPRGSDSNPRGYGRFEPAVIGPSVERSLEALQTEHLDFLLLHEPRLSDPTPDAEQALRSLLRQGLVQRLGVGTSFQWDSLPKFGDVAQFAIDGQSMRAPDSRILVAHGVLRGHAPQVFEGCARGAGIFDELPDLRRHLAGPTGNSALLLNTVLFGTNLHRILISTNSPRRLQSLLATAATVHAEIQSRIDAKLSARFTDCAIQYFDRKAVSS
jgi:hypothetical protein